MSVRETDCTSASLTEWLASMCLSITPPSSPSSCLFIAEGIHRLSWIVISTTQHALSNITCFFVCLPGPVSKNGLYFLTVLLLYAISCVQLSGIVVEGEGFGYRMKGRRSHWICYRINFSREVSSTVTTSSSHCSWIEMLHLLWGMAPIYHFCGANTLDVGSSYLGEIHQLFRFPSSIWGLSIWSVYFKPWCLTSGKMNWCV